MLAGGLAGEVGSMDALDGLPEHEESPAGNFVVSSTSGDTEFHYDLWRLTTAGGQTIQCIVIAAVEDRFLVAFPHAVWHRQVARRVLGPVLSKPALVEVACCSEDDRESLAEETTMKVWCGYVTAECFGELELISLEDATDYPFKALAGEGYLPFASAFLEVLREHFEFLSAQSEAGVRQGGQGAVLQSIDARVGSLEPTMEKMSESMQVLLERVAQVPAQAQPSSKRVAFKPGAPEQMVPGATLEKMRKKYPSLDPGVASAAVAAGVSEGHLVEMQKLMGSGAISARRLREPALRRPTSSKSPTRMPAEAVLLESEDDGEDVAASGLGEDDSPVTLSQAVTKLTELVGLLSADKIKRSKASKVEIAMEGLAGGSGAAESSGSGAGKRAAAVRRALRVALQESPEEVSAVVERLLAEDLTMRTQTPGTPSVGFNARAWLEHRSRVGAYKTSAHCAWSAAGILDDLVSGRVQHARARAGLLLLQLDQVAIDKGQWTLGAELALEQGPPLSVMAGHTLPSVGDGESPFSRLLDPRWAEVMLSHLRDAEDYVQKRRNLGKKLDESTQDKDSKPKPKAKGKGKPQADSAAE